MSATTRTEKPVIFEIGTVIADKWVILEFIGKGAMGEVYRAHQVNLQRDVAIKVVSREWLQSFDEGDQEIETSVQRFRREVQAMAQIRHSNVLQVYDHGTVLTHKSTGDHPVEFIAMEFIPGHNLRYTMSEEGFYPEEKLLREWLAYYFIPVLKGVEAVHLLDVTHRDLKPENILLDGDIPKIADFGLARSRRMRPVTQSMDMKGTLHYMSPEHFFDFRKADHRADIYSLGKILFEAADGKFEENTTPFRQVSLSEADSPFYEEINRIIVEATAEKIADRIDSTALLRRQIEQALSNSAIQEPGSQGAKGQAAGFWHRPRWIWTGVAAALFSMGAMTVWHLMGEPGIDKLDRPQSVVSTGKSTSQKPAEIQSRDPAPSPKQNSTNSQPDLPNESGVAMRAIPGGEITIPAIGSSDVSRTVTLPPFQIEEAPVTNHQFIEFLNSQLSSLTIARGVVRDENEIWLLLGEIIDGYDPIVFRNGRFQLRNAGYAAHPVLRVSPYGASAYAAYYGRRLPTRAEWYMAMGKSTVIPDKAAVDAGKIHESGGFDTADMERMHARMLQGTQSQSATTAPPAKKKPVPITSMKVNQKGLRVMGSNFGEWALKKSNESPGLNLLDEDAILLPENVSRKPWEAFEEVGFRCVKPLHPDEIQKRSNGVGTIDKSSPDRGRN